MFWSINNNACAKKRLVVEYLQSWIPFVEERCTSIACCSPVQSMREHQGSMQHLQTARQRLEVETQSWTHLPYLSNSVP